MAPPTTTTTTTTPTPILIPHHPTPPLDSPLLASLQTALLTPPTIKNLRTTLEKETQAHGWQEKVRQRTLQLLASREYWKWEDLVGVVVREARGIVEEEEEEEEEGEGQRGKKEEKGNGGRDGEGEDEERVDIRIPEKAVTEAVKVVRGVLETKVELEPEGKGFWD